MSQSRLPTVVAHSIHRSFVDIKYHPIALQKGDTGTIEIDLVKMKWPWWYTPWKGGGGRLEVIFTSSAETNRLSAFQCPLKSSAVGFGLTSSAVGVGGHICFRPRNEAKCKVIANEMQGIYYSSSSSGLLGTTPCFHESETFLFRKGVWFAHGPRGLLMVTCTPQGNEEGILGHWIVRQNMSYAWFHVESRRLPWIVVETKQELVNPDGC